MGAARECVGDFGCAARGEEDMVVQNGKVDNLVLLNAQNLFWSSEDAATLPTHYGEAAAGVWAIFQKNPECPLDSGSLTLEVWCRADRICIFIIAVSDIERTTTFLPPAHS